MTRTSINCNFQDGYAYYEEWQDVMKKADEDAKVLLRHFGDTLKKRDDVCFLNSYQSLDQLQSDIKK